MASKLTLEAYAKEVFLSNTVCREKLIKLYGSATARPPLLEFRERYIRYLQKGAAGRKELKEGDLDPAQEKAKKDKADRELKQIAIGEKEGRLVDAEELKAKLVTVGGQIRTRLMGMGARLANQLAAETEVRQVQAAIDDEVRATLLSLDDEIID